MTVIAEGSRETEKQLRIVQSVSLDVIDVVMMAVC